MPLVRVPNPALSSTKWKTLVDALRRERNEPTASGEPMIFEIPVEEPNKIEALVIWQEWTDLPSADRTNIILEAYEDQRDNLVQGIGATYDEAIQQHLLPYRMVSVLDRPKKFLSLMCPTAQEQSELRDAINGALLQEAGARRIGDGVELRFPTKEMADQAQFRLFDRFRNGYWSIDH